MFATEYPVSGAVYLVRGSEEFGGAADNLTGGPNNPGSVAENRGSSLKHLECKWANFATAGDNLASAAGNLIARELSNARAVEALLLFSRRNGAGESRCTGDISSWIPEMAYPWNYADEIRISELA